MLTHDNLMAASLAYGSEVDPVTPGDAILHAAPMSHGSASTSCSTSRGSACKWCRKAAASSRRRSSRCSMHWPRMSMFAAPTMIKRLVACPADLNAENIRTLIWGGAPMYVEDALAALDRFGPRLAQIYGQGEAPMTITTLSKEDIADRDHPRWRERLGSAGKPYANVEVMVADAQDRPVAHGRTWRNPLPRRHHVRLLAKSGGDRGLAARRLAAYRRRRRVRRKKAISTSRIAPRT